MTLLNCLLNFLPLNLAIFAFANITLKRGSHVSILLPLMLMELQLLFDLFLSDAETLRLSLQHVNGCADTRNLLFGDLKLIISLFLHGEEFFEQQLGFRQIIIKVAFKKLNSGIFHRVCQLIF